ncbi:MAG: hypothetical protein K2O27_05810, partial [Candidatus Amulumruptor sp.]|nr:hypothetical protein [Candidatus Amulumruptor sp.]
AQSHDSAFGFLTFVVKVYTGMFLLFQIISLWLFFLFSFDAKVSAKNAKSKFFRLKMQQRNKFGTIFV